MIGKTVSHYRILEELGRGGMGVVYKAQDTKLKRTVALKFLPPHLTKNETDLARFMQEARAAASLNHPNVCTIHEINDESENPFIVMEYVQGNTLREMINTPLDLPSRGEKEISPPLKGDLGGCNGLPLIDVINISTQIAEALKAAHEKGIIHRDIKSENIMVTETGQVKVMDFGLAKLRDSIRLTKIGSTTGTTAYMSPEQFQEKEIDHRTDIWSLGVVLYEMLTGRLPFQGNYDQAVVYSILNEEPQSVSELRIEVPKMLLTIIKNTLTKDRESRYTSVGALLHDLSSFQKIDSKVPFKQFSFARLLHQPRFALLALLAFFTFGFLIIWLLNRHSKADWARQQAIPEIIRLIEKEEYIDAWQLAHKAEQEIPNDPLFAQLLPQMTHTASIYTVPPGASIEIIDYKNHENSWIQLGNSPMDNIRIPRGFFRWKIEKPGFETLEVAGASDGVTINFVLDSIGTKPPDMVRVVGGSVLLPFAGLFRREGTELETFLMDKFEVTNRQYKAFVDGGGYEKPAFWQQPFIKNGKQLSFEAAMAEFRDATGRPGPATWELGTYPEGQEYFPVSGVSWYEAAAYAEFVGKELPTVYHWARAASHSASPWLLPHSNFSGAGDQPIGERINPGYFGTYDLAGNVREWCWNETGGTRFILGGAWNEPAYVFNFAIFTDPFDRSVQNGFRCIQQLQKPSNIAELKIAFDSIVQRDFTQESPVSDESFNLFKRLFNYDRTTLNTKTVLTDSVSSNHWIRVTVSIGAAYGNERMAVHLFLPKAGKPPFQTIILFPGANALYRSSSERIEDLASWDGVDFLPQSGRAVVYPIYKGTYERRDGYNLETATPNSDRDHSILWRKDLGRTIDYLETRTDIDTSKLCFYGSSLGACQSPIFLALEKRIDLSINRLVGLIPWEVLPETDPLNFISHVSQPILILNGRYDQILPYESCQKPFFNLLGTSAGHKQMVLFDVTHRSPRPRNKAIKETLDWLDRYFGPVTQ